MASSDDQDNKNLGKLHPQMSIESTLKMRSPTLTCRLMQMTNLTHPPLLARRTMVSTLMVTMLLLKVSTMNNDVVDTDGADVVDDS